MNPFKFISAAVVALMVALSASADPIRLGVSGQGNNNGFRILDVLPNTPASDVGLESGDRIITVNNTVITSGPKLGQVLADANANGGHVAMLVQDVRGTGYLMIECDLLEEVVTPVYQSQAGPGAQQAPVAAVKKAVARNIKKTRVGR